jgi:hypothetical protein
MGRTATVNRGRGWVALVPTRKLINFPKINPDFSARKACPPKVYYAILLAAEEREG